VGAEKGQNYPLPNLILVQVTHGALALRVTFSLIDVGSAFTAYLALLFFSIRFQTLF
jgi:hypothetical protein